MESTITKVTLGKIWIPAQYRELSEDTHSINALTWEKMHKREKLSYNSPLIPLKDTKYLAPGIEKMFGKWIIQENVQLKDLMEQDKLCMYQELKHKNELIVIDRWRYTQLKHFFKALTQPIRTAENLLWKNCVDAGRKRVITVIYKILRHMKGLDIQPFIGKWEKDLGARVNDLETRQLLKRGPFHVGK